MVDPRGGRCGDRRLGVVGDAEAGCLDHRDSLAPSPTASVSIVVETEGLAQLDQRGELGVAAEDRLGDLAGQLAVASTISSLARFS